MIKDYKFGEEARQELKKGIDVVADAVRITLGPRGRNVVLDKGYGPPVITNDGVTIAKEMIIEDRFQNMGAELIKEVAEKTNDVAGDGTTTAIVLAQAIVEEGYKNVVAGSDPLSLKKGIDAAVKFTIEALNKIKKVVDSKAEIAQVATIASEDEKVGSMIADVIEEVGQDGVITVEESQTFGLSKEVVRGLQFDKGFISPYMITNPEKLVAECKNPYILITDKKITSLDEIIPVLEKITNAGSKEFVVIAETVDGEPLNLLIVNKLRGIIQSIAVQAPEFGDRREGMLEDIAIVTGGKLISEKVGLTLEGIELDMLGRADKFIATKNSSTIIGGKGKKTEIEKRAKLLKSQINSEKSDFDRDKLQERAAKLSEGVAIIKVGAATEAEIKHKRDKIEDALNATRAAIEEGIVIGGGAALVKIIKTFSEVNEEWELNDEELIGVQIVKKALLSPIRQIAKNAGIHDISVIINEIEKGENIGYDFTKIKDGVVDMSDAGIIDPVKVIRSGLENAASMASIFLTTETAIVLVLEKEKKNEE